MYECFSITLSGLAGETNEEEAICDMLVVAMEDDLIEKYWDCTFFEKDPEKKVNINTVLSSLRYLSHVVTIYYKNIYL